MNNTHLCIVFYVYLSVADCKRILLFLVNQLHKAYYALCCSSIHVANTFVVYLFTHTNVDKSIVETMKISFFLIARVYNRYFHIFIWFNSKKWARIQLNLIQTRIWKRTFSYMYVHALLLLYRFSTDFMLPTVQKTSGNNSIIQSHLFSNSIS